MARTWDWLTAEESLIVYDLANIPNSTYAYRNSLWTFVWTTEWNFTISNVDNIRLDWNTISSTNTNWNILISPNGNWLVSAVNNLSYSWTADNALFSVILENSSATWDTSSFRNDGTWLAWYFVGTNASGDVLKVESTNASYASSVLRVTTTRASSTAFNLLRIQTNSWTQTPFNIRWDWLTSISSSTSATLLSLTQTWTWENNLTLTRSSGTSSTWSVYLPTGSSDLRLYSGADRFIFSVTWSLSTQNKIYAWTDAGATQSACWIYAWTWAPSNANGSNGDVYIRSDGWALTTIYQKRAWTWTWIV